MSSIREHDKVVEKIRDANSQKFDVRTNLGKEEHYVGQLFPDLILLDKTTGDPIFIIEVKYNGLIAQCIQQWKNVSSIPATLYIVVPKAELQNAKSIADVVGLNTKFGSYVIDKDGTTVVIKYE